MVPCVSHAMRNAAASMGTMCIHTWGDKHTCMASPRYDMHCTTRHVSPTKAYSSVMAEYLHNQDSGRDLGEAQGTGAGGHRDQCLDDTRKVTS